MTDQLDLFEVYVGDVESEDFDLGTACSLDPEDECESCQ